MELSDTRLIDAPADVVWQCTIDVTTWPDYTPTVTSVTPTQDGPLAVGSTAVVKQPGQRATTWTVRELDPAAHRFVWTADVVGMRTVATHTVEAIDAEHCRNTLALSMTGASSRLLGPLLRRRLAKVLATENAGFAQAAADALAARTPAT
jgi:hypothetical protein